MANTSKKTTTQSTADTTVDTSAVVDTEKEVVETNKSIINKNPLKDDDEIKVISLIPNVSYKDNKNNDFYEWDNIGHEELMSYSVLKDMNRNHKSYFKDLWLKPIDDRVIKILGLESTYKNYEDLMTGSNYTLDNIGAIKEKLDVLQSKGIKSTVVTKIKNMVSDGEISDVKVVKNLERMLQIDLFDLLDL